MIKIDYNSLEQYLIKSLFYDEIITHLGYHRGIKETSYEGHLSKQLTDTLTRARQICTENEVRLTEKREKVLSALVQSGQAMSAYELAEQYRELFEQSIPAMSVYRILDFLAEMSLVHKLSSANKYIACSHISCSHEHQIPQFLICETCNTVTEIAVKSSVIEELSASVAKTGFTLANEQLELTGFCQNCQGK